jgi:hypothetical protein
MLYHVDFRIEYPASMSQKDFFSIWAREAEAGLGAKKAGVVIGGTKFSQVHLCSLYAARQRTARRLTADTKIDRIAASDRSWPHSARGLSKKSVGLSG